MSTGSPSHSHVEKILNRQGVGRFDRLSYTAALYLAIQICTQLSLPNGSWTFQCHLKLRLPETSYVDMYAVDGLQVGQRDLPAFTLSLHSMPAANFIMMLSP